MWRVFLRSARSWGHKGCFSVNSMREFADLPLKARQIMVASVMKAHQLLIDNLAAARGSRADNDVENFDCGDDASTII